MNEIQQHQPTVIQVIEPQPPQQQVVYHIHLDNQSSWLMLLAQMSTTNMIAMSVAVGIAGAIVLGLALTLAAAVTQVAIVAAVTVVVVAIVAMVVSS